MSSLNILVKLEDSETVVKQRYQRPTGNPKEQARALQELFKRLGSGLASGSVDVQTGSADPVAASGTFTLESVIATDAITIGPTTFTFTSSPTQDTDVEVDGADDAADAAALAAAINAHPTVSQVVTAEAEAAVVTVTANIKGVAGNFINISSADSTITASGTHLENGAGGGAEEAVNYHLGIAM